jgi:hypothetical protein
VKPCWREAGLTELGARQADLALDDMMSILRRVSAEGARAALEEAVFRTLTLPMRTPAFRVRYLKENGPPVSPTLRADDPKEPR